jgi:hypothetical protein
MRANEPYCENGSNSSIYKLEKLQKTKVEVKAEYEELIKKVSSLQSKIHGMQKVYARVAKRVDLLRKIEMLGEHLITHDLNFDTDKFLIIDEQMENLDFVGVLDKMLIKDYRKDKVISLLVDDLNNWLVAGDFPKELKEWNVFTSRLWFSWDKSPKLKPSEIQVWAFRDEESLQSFLRKLVDYFHLVIKGSPKEMNEPILIELCEKLFRYENWGLSEEEDWKKIEYYHPFPDGDSPLNPDRGITTLVNLFEKIMENADAYYEIRHSSYKKQDELREIEETIFKNSKEQPYSNDFDKQILQMKNEFRDLYEIRKRKLSNVQALQQAYARIGYRIYLLNTIERLGKILKKHPYLVREEGKKEIDIRTIELVQATEYWDILKKNSHKNEDMKSIMEKLICRLEVTERSHNLAEWSWIQESLQNTWIDSEYLKPNRALI